MKDEKGSTEMPQWQHRVGWNEEKQMPLASRERIYRQTRQSTYLRQPRLRNPCSSFFSTNNWACRKADSSAKSRPQNDVCGALSTLCCLLEKIAVDGFVFGQLRMERAGQQVALLHQDGQFSCAAQDFDAFADAADDGRADEDHLHGAAGEFRTLTLLD